jgi:hypothetical protein
MGLRMVALTLVVGLAIVFASSVAAARPRPPSWALHGPYSPKIDPSEFVAAVNNRYFALKPGTRFHYTGVLETTPQIDDMVVLHRTKEILGVRCTVVRDTVSEHGKPLERTFDWYAQDQRGNVWYMGENSLELKHGRFVRADDSWQSGVKGAKPGIIMRGKPEPGQVYRQEYYPPGGALDQARVLSRRVSVKVPYGSFDRALATLEWSPVEPQLEQKFYVAGVGEVAEHVTQGGRERFQLVSVTRGYTSRFG